MNDFAVTIDADCLYSAPIRDTLLRLAHKGLFRPHWSDEIVSEATRNLVGNGVMTESQARRLAQTLKEAFPEAHVRGYQRLISGLTCDEKDRHVLAVAVRSQSQILVTNNVRHFPEESVAALELEVQTADEFLCNQFGLAPPLVCGVVVEQAAALRNPPRTIHDLLDILGRLTPRFSHEVCEGLGLAEVPGVVQQAEQIAREATRRRRSH